MKEFITTRLVRCDGTDYEEGESIELDSKTAEPLLARGAIVIPGAMVDEKTFDAVTVEEIVEAINQLDPENDAHFTNSGIPQVKSLEQILGRDITAADRDAAWQVVVDKLENSNGPVALEDVIAAIKLLDANDAALFVDGVPTLDAVQGVLEREITEDILAGALKAISEESSGD